jgi:UPF0288 family protein (methanogenesis marker protein 3)
MILRMNVAKLSVSLDPTRINFIEQYQTNHAVRTKSEVVDRALELLQQEELKHQYAAAYQEWEDAGEEIHWASSLADGLEPTDQTLKTKAKKPGSVRR